MVGLPGGKKTLRICITVYTQYRRVTDGRTDILPRHSPRYAYASRGNKQVVFGQFEKAGQVICTCSRLDQVAKEKAW